MLLRGDTDFSQTTQLDRWDEDSVEFVFGMDAMPNFVELAENLPDSAWRELTRPPKTTRKTQQTRARRPNFKEQCVIEKEYKNKRQSDKRRIVRMDFRTFCQSLIQIPAQILSSGRRLIYRLLTWTPSVETLFRVHDCVSRPLRH